MSYLVNANPFTCRFCDTELRHSMVDLGVSPLCEDFIQQHELHEKENFFPLEAMVCHNCFLVQVAEYSSNSEIFDEDYGYYSSFSTSWLAHCKRYADMISEKLSLDQESFVVEIASNDGYMLRNFVEKNIPCLGIDPAKNVADAAAKVGVKTHVDFFTEKLATQLSSENKNADLIIGNNVLAHTPYVKDFFKAISVLLKPTGTATFEFPHLLNLMQQVQFDTIYHEHFSYYSLETIARIFESVGLIVEDVEEIEPAGGSLRVYVRHANESQGPLKVVDDIISREREYGLREVSTYEKFQQSTDSVKHSLLKMLIELKENGKSVVGYGAPGKGNTLLNYCGIKPDLLPYTVDMNIHKHGRYLPGSRIPVFAPTKIEETKPDYILILPWNLTREISAQLSYVKNWGAKFIVPIPTAKIFE